MSINFLHFAVLLFVICCAVLVIASLWSEPPDASRVVPLTFRHHRAAALADPSRGFDIALSVGLVGLVLAAWLYF